MLTSLSVCIISLFCGFVKHYFCPGAMCATRAHHTKREEWGIVSCIIRYYFNPCGTGSHLYTANTNTLRSVHWVKDLLALVGTHLSWSPCPPLLYPYYITSLMTCQPLSQKFFELAPANSAPGQSVHKGRTF